MKITRPTVSLLKGCEYTPSHRTDIRRTIQRERERLARMAKWPAETQQILHSADKAREGSDD